MRLFGFTPQMSENYYFQEPIYYKSGRKTFGWHKQEADCPEGILVLSLFLLAIVPCLFICSPPKPLAKTKLLDSFWILHLLQSWILEDKIWALKQWLTRGWLQTKYNVPSLGPSWDCFSTPHTSLAGQENCILAIFISFLIMFLPFVAIKVSFGYLFILLQNCTQMQTLWL